MITINRYLAALLAFLFVATTSSCEQVTVASDDDDVAEFDDDDDMTPSDDDDVVLNKSSIVGVVLNAYGTPLSGVTVNILGTDISTESDLSGRFLLENLLAAERAIITFRKDLYARTSVPIAIVDGSENTIIQRMALIDHVFFFEALDGFTFNDNASLKVDFPANNIVDNSGKPYNGSVVVELTVFDLVSNNDQGNELLATPGDFTAVNSAGEDKTLESYGMVQINMSAPSGAELQLGEAPSVVRLPVQSLGVPPVVGDEISAWSYNEEQGKWIEEAVGAVSEYEGELVWEFNAPHFSTWNCDRPIATHGCLTGTVTDSQGNPRGSATVRAVGITYISTTTARTSQNGSFCLEVKNGETVWAEISYSIAGQTATQRTDPITISPGQASCTLGEGTCDDLGIIPVDIQTCIGGVVVDSQNLPQEGAQVVTPSGGVATTNVDGSFCMSSPVFQSSDIFVLAELNAMSYRPVSLYTQPGLPDCQAGCPNAVVLRPYTTMSCVEGSVVVATDDSTVQDNIIVEVYDLNYPAVRIGGTLSGGDGSYCAQVPGETTVSVQVGPAESPCASATLDTDAMGGQSCGDGPQTSECQALEEFVCNL